MSVTVLVLAYNHERWIRECVESVLSQDGVEKSVVVVNDGSSDGTAGVLAGMGPEVEVLSLEKNQGPKRTLETIIPGIETEFLKILGGDDVLLPGALSKPVDELRDAGTAYGLAYSGYGTIDEEGNRGEEARVPRHEGCVTDHLIAGWCPPALTIVLRTEAIQEFLPYSDYGIFSEWDMWLRMSDRWKFLSIPGSLGLYRQVGGSLSRRYEAMPERRVSHAKSALNMRNGDKDRDAVIAERVWREAMDLWDLGEREMATEFFDVLAEMGRQR